MGVSNLKNIIRSYLLSPSQKRLFCSTNAIATTGLFCSQSPKPTYHFQSFNSVQLWNAQKALVSFRFRNARMFCSEIVQLNNPQDSPQIDDVTQKMYKIIMINHMPYSGMESALDSLELKLTGEIVAELLFLFRFDEKLAFRFFTWAGQQEKYSHGYRIYSDMIEILSNTKPKVKQYRILCDMLDYLKRNDTKSVPIDVLVVFLKNYCQKYLTRVGKLVNSEKVRAKSRPESYALNHLVESLCECALVEDAEGIVRRIGSTVEPNFKTFNALFFGWCSVRNPTRAIMILNEMIRRDLEPDNNVYTTALESFRLAKMVEAAVKLFEFMRNGDATVSSPTAKNYAQMIQLMIENDRIGDAEKYLALMMSTGCLPDVSVYKKLIEVMCLAGKIDMAYDFIREMGNKGYPPDIVTYNCFLKVLCDNKHIEEAVGLFKAMSESNCMPSVQSYNMLMAMFFKVDDSEGAIAIWDEMYKRNCQRDAESYCTMIKGFFDCERDRDACNLLDEVVNKDIKVPFKMSDYFLAKLSKIGNLRAIHRFSDHMRKFITPKIAQRYAGRENYQNMRRRLKFEP